MFPVYMWLDVYMTLLLWVAGVPLALYAFIHALRQRADAFTAANKQTKVIWGAITGVAALVMFFTEGPFFLSTGPPGFLWLLGLIAVLVYIVDVRPRVVEIQQGRW